MRLRADKRVLAEVDTGGLTLCLFAHLQELGIPSA